MFAMVIMNTSCEKPTNDLIPTDLTGNKWICTSLDYAGSTYTETTAPTFAALNLTKDFVCVDFKFDADLTVTFYSKYTGTVNNNDNWVSTPFSYSISDGVLNISNGYLKFEIVSHTVTTLKLKLKEGNADMPVEGTYTLTR